MKHTAKYFAFAAIVAALMSCQKITKDTLSEETDPQEQVIPADWVEMTFGTETEDSKFKLDGLQVKFENGDQVTVLWDGGSAIGTVEDGQITFLGDPTAPAFYAVYPAGKAVLSSTDPTKLTVTTPSSGITGAFKDACIMVAKANDNIFSFKHAVGLTSFSFSNPGSTSTKLYIRGNLEESICGSFSVGFDDDFEPVIDISGATGKQISTAAAKFEKDVTYYMPVLPGASLPFGFGVNINVVNSSTAVSGSLTSTPFEFARGTISKLGNAQKAHDYYFKPDGTGKGTSWEDAGGPALLVKILGNTITNKNGTATNAGYTNGYRIHNRTLYLAGGEYDLADNGGPVVCNWMEDTNFTIQGGYDASTGTKDTLTQKTYLKTSVQNVPVIKFTGYIRTGKMNDIRFKELPANTGNAAAVEFTSSSKTVTSEKYVGMTFKDCFFVDNTQLTCPLVYVNFKSGTNTGKINFTGCKFLRNTTSGSTGRTGLGVTLASSSVTAEFTDCVFSENTGTRPALYASYSKTVNVTNCQFTFNDLSYSPFQIAGSKGTRIGVDGCTFLNNSSVNNGGGLNMDTVDTLTLKNSTFTGNKATKTDATGGAIYLNYVSQGEDNATITGCSFDGNQVLSGTNCQGGAIRAAFSQIAFDDCDFQNNESPVYGGAVQCASNSVLSFDDCIFDGNEAGRVGGGLYNVTGTVTINGGSFTSNTAKYGGAICQRGVNDDQFLKCTGVTFTSNASQLDAGSDTYGGGAVSNVYSMDGDYGVGPANFTRCKFISNTASGCGGAVSLYGKVTYTFDQCVFSGNKGYYGGDIDIKGISSKITTCFINRCSFRDYSITATSNGSAYYSYSVNAHNSYTDLGINNCSFDRYSSVSGAMGTTTGNCVCFKGNGVIVNTTAFALGTQMVRFDGTTTQKNFTINNLLVHSTNDDGISINQLSGRTQYGYNNLLCKGKNTYGTLAATDVLCKKSNLTTKTWVDDPTTGLRYLNWVANVTVPDANYITETEIESLMSTNFVAFDTWLKSVAGAHPYSIDILGNSRNTSKFQKGSYDTGL